MIKPKLGFVLLFVDNPAKSAQFYTAIFNQKPLEESPTFALFSLDHVVLLGLWSRHTAEPQVETQPGAMEICFPVDSVDLMYNQLLHMPLTFLQKPCDMDFGRTCVFLDPDRHRIRLYSLKEAEKA